eukprot:SM000076S21798  [mRNA]  locus=s76:307670:309281:+ [translate_table: standard]
MVAMAAAAAAAAHDDGGAAAAVIADEARLLVHTYARAPVVIERGRGSTLWDAAGKPYLDFMAGIAVNALGHADPAWVAAVTTAAETLCHVSNLYHTAPQVELARRLVGASFADRCFFANSGTEANEAAVKFARKRQLLDRGAGVATGFVSFTGSFHGRTLGALALTAKKAYQEPFEPLMPGVHVAEYGSVESAAAIVEKGGIAGVFVEPVQGEGGVYPAAAEFLRGLRQLCDDTGTLLIFDEVQCGLGRSGHLWAHEASGVVPDMMTLAKPLAGGLPIGAVLMTEEVASAVRPGDHGSTFAGGPLVCSAALAVLDRLQAPGFLGDVAAKGERLRAGLRKHLGDNPHVKEVRGEGLLVGVQLDCPAGPLVDAARTAGLLVITAGKGDVVRLAPPLVVTDAEVDEAVDILARCMHVLH